ncbi:MAG: hypothetical protein ACRD97_04635 [Nitrososphaeraceae archaeon]
MIRAIRPVILAAVDVLFPLRGAEAKGCDVRIASIYCKSGIML